MTLACGRDNRLVDTGGWSTTMGPDGRTHWTPPPLLDVGQPRTNHYWHPTLYLIRPGVSGEFFCWEGWARGNEVNRPRFSAAFIRVAALG